MGVNYTSMGGGGGSAMDVDRIRADVDKLKDDFRQLIIDLREAAPKGWFATIECLNAWSEKIDAARAAEALR